MSLRVKRSNGDLVVCNAHHEWDRCMFNVNKKAFFKGA